MTKLFNNSIQVESHGLFFARKTVFKWATTIFSISFFVTPIDYLSGCQSSDSFSLCCGSCRSLPLNLDPLFMNPYLEIAREHATTEELAMLLAERKRPTPKKMTKDQEQRAMFRKGLEKLI